MDETEYNEDMLLNYSLDDKPLDEILADAVPILSEEDIIAEQELVKIYEEGFDSKTAEETVAIKEEPDADQPTDFDVLCGQSRTCANHAGNKRFQSILDSFAKQYEISSNKQEKMTLTKEIVACVKESSGRFLKFKDGVWTEISDVTARDKVSHALRTKAASWKRQQEKALEEKPSAKSKRAHRRKKTGHHRRSSSSSSISNAAARSFDSSNSTSSSVVEALLRSQREIFANLTKGEAVIELHPLKSNGSL